MTEHDAGVVEVLTAHLFTVYERELICDERGGKCTWTTRIGTTRASEDEAIDRHAAHVAERLRAADATLRADVERVRDGLGGSPRAALNEILTRHQADQ